MSKILTKKLSEITDAELQEKRDSLTLAIEEEEYRLEVEYGSNMDHPKRLKEEREIDKMRIKRNAIDNEISRRANPVLKDIDIQIIDAIIDGPCGLPLGAQVCKVEDVEAVIKKLQSEKNQLKILALHAMYRWLLATKIAMQKRGWSGIAERYRQRIEYFFAAWKKAKASK